MSPTPGETSDNWRTTVGPYLTMGMELAIAVVGMFFIGKWIDTWLECEPWGMYVGLGIGVVGGLIRFIRRALELGALQDAQQEKDEQT